MGFEQWYKHWEVNNTGEDGCHRIRLRVILIWSVKMKYEKGLDKMCKEQQNCFVLYNNLF
jgi:hypothetical protein